MSNQNAEATMQAKREASDDAKSIKDKAKTDSKGAAELLHDEVAKADGHEGWDADTKKAYKAELTKRLFDDNKNLEDRKIIGALAIEYVSADKGAAGITENQAADLKTIKTKAAEAADTDPLRAAMLNNFAASYAELKNEFRDDGKTDGTEDTKDGISSADLDCRVQKDRKVDEERQTMVTAAQEAGVEPYAQLKGGKVLFDVAREKLDYMNSLKPENERTSITNSQVFAECANIMKRSNDGRFSDVDPDQLAKSGQRGVPKDWNQLTSNTNLQLFSSEELAEIKAIKAPPKPTEAAPVAAVPAPTEAAPVAAVAAPTESAPVIAAPGETPRPEMLSQKNWLLAIDEKTNKSRFDDIDTVKDGYLTREEINAYRHDHTIGVPGEEVHDNYLKELAAKKDDIEEASDDEYFDEDNGLTRADIEQWTQQEIQAFERKTKEDQLKAEQVLATAQAKAILADEKFFLALSGYDNVVSIPDVDKYKAELMAKTDGTPEEQEERAKQIKAIEQIRAELIRRSTHMTQRGGTQSCRNDGTMTETDRQNW